MNYFTQQLHIYEVTEFVVLSFRFLRLTQTLVLGPYRSLLMDRPLRNPRGDVSRVLIAFAEDRLPLFTKLVSWRRQRGANPPPLVHSWTPY